MVEEVATRFSAETADFEGGVKRMVSGVDTLAESSARLKTALESTGAASHDVDALFKQITGSCRTMGDATVVLNQALRSSVIPVSDLNVLSERLHGHFAALSGAARQAGTAIKEVGGSGAELAAVNDNARAASAAMREMGGMTVGAKREIMVLAHEAMSGNFARMPGSLMVLAERFGSVGMAAMRTLAPIAALGFVAYEVESHAEHAAQALARMETALTLNGQAGLFTRQGLEATVNSLSRMHGITKEAADGVVAEFSRIASVTPQLMSDLSRGMEGWVLVTGEEAPAAAHKLAQSIADPEKFLEDLERQTHNVSAGTMDMVARLVDMGDVMGAKAAAAREFGDVMERAAEQIKTPFQRAAQEAGNALRDLADAFAGSDEHGQHLARVMHGIADALDAMRVPAAIIGKAFRDLIDIIGGLIHAFGYCTEAMQALAGPAASTVVDAILAMAAAAKGDFAKAGEIMAGMPGRIAEEWQIHSAAMIRHIQAIKDAASAIGKPYLPGHQPEQPGQEKPHEGGAKAAPSGNGQNSADRDKQVLEILNRTLTVQRELRQIDGEKKILKEQLTGLETRLAEAPDAEKGKLKAQISDIKEAMRLEDERAANLKKKDGGESQMEGWRRQLAEIQSADKRSLDERKADDLKFWQDKKAHLAQGSKEFAQVTMEERRLEKAIAADAHAERLADLERQRAEAAKGSEQRVALARREAEEVKRYAGEHSKAYQDALKRIVEMEKEHRKEMDRIAADGIEARAGAEKAALETEAENLRFLRDLGALDEHDKLARLRQIKAEEYQIERDSLQQKLALKSLEASERDRIQKQIAQLDQSYRLQDLAATHQQTLAVLHDWQTTWSGIGSASGTAVKGMIIQGQSFQQSERNLALGLANVFADLALKKVGSWIWSEGVMRAWSKITGQQEVVDAVSKESAKTGAVTAGQAARTASSLGGAAARNAAEASEHSSFLARIGEQIAQWLGLETAKTAETVTEAAARSGAESASTIAAIAAAKASAAGEIPAYAAIAASAAMASVACIPFVGWAMAPAVGEETYAMAMTFLPMASARGGWERVPEDGMITELHKDEKVLSAPFSLRLDKLMNNVETMQTPQTMALPSPSPLRLPVPAAASIRPSPIAEQMAGAMAGSGQGSGDIHLHAVDAASFNNLCRRPASARNLMGIVRSEVSSGNPLARKK